MLAAVLVCLAIAALWLPLLWRLTREPAREEVSLLMLFKAHLAARIRRMNQEEQTRLARKRTVYR
jgi:hypothetical protein